MHQVLESPILPLATTSSPEGWHLHRLALDTGSPPGAMPARAAEVRAREELQLAGRLRGLADSDGRRIVLFASVEGGPNCARICARAGILLATQDRRSVCVVDAHVRWPEVHEWLPVDESMRSTSPERLVAANFWLLSPQFTPATPGQPSLASLRPYLRELGARFQHVFVVAPRLGSEMDALELAAHCDGVILIVEAHLTRRDTLQALKATMEALRVPLLGVVLNNRTFPIPDALYRMV